MRQVLLFLLLFPAIVYSQNNHSMISKKAFKKAKIEMDKGNLDIAYSMFELIVKDDQTFIEAFYNLSVIDYSKSNYSKALISSKNALKINKVQNKIYSQIGKSFFMLNDFDSSSYYFELATLFGGDSANDYYLLAKSENNKKEYSNALSIIDEAIQKDNSIADYYVVKGNSYFGNLDFDNAKLAFEKALAINPSQSNLYASLAGVCIELGESDTALENINKGIKNAKGDDKITFMILKGNYFKQNNELDNAEQTFNEAFKLDNKNTSVLINQSAIMIKKGDYENAVLKCTEAIEIDGSLFESFYNRGIAREMLKNIEGACMDWEEAFLLGSIKAEDFVNSPTCNE